MAIQEVKPTKMQVVAKIATMIAEADVLLLEAKKLAQQNDLPFSYENPDLNINTDLDWNNSSYQC